jgi:hypothetical protein
MEQFDLTQLIIALVITFLPALLRELRNFYHDWKMQDGDTAYRLERAAEFAVKAAQVWRENMGATGLEAEKHAVNVAQSYLNKSGVNFSVALVYSAVKAAYFDYIKNEPVE